MFDVFASISLLCGAIGHYAQLHESFVQSVGAAGVSLKWFGVLDYLRSFRSSGTLVRMIVVVTQDIGPFLFILLIVVIIQYEKNLGN